MHSYRFLLSRRWLLFGLTVVLLSTFAWWLGEWQFGRLEDRKDRNAAVRANEDQDPTPVEDVLAPPGGDLPRDEEWRVVTATGTYDVDDTVIVRYRTRDGQAGVDVVVPLVTAGGTAVVVNRGWLATENRGTASPDDVPAPPSGEVTITGWARVDGTGDSIAVEDQSTRAINSERIGAALSRDVYGGFVNLRSEDPPAATTLEQTELPELDNGPHFFYGLQWWFFGVLALFGFGYLAYDEHRRGPRGERPHREPRPRRTNVPAGSQRRDAVAQSARSMPPSTGSMTPDTNDAAGDSRNAAARPNSAGSP
ncbi:SURF1 family protein [Nocardioides dongxiaopingii]|uniref:SURF1 family cytochrome oxidase biogenesis protein n=1 Tax=Nocardioides TaxID=1839 RepID=UPI0010C7627B|nr:MULTISPECIES: SURF1 family protein [Nocardioides]QCW50655.2 SURF1 family protein [Nocardioides sp. S-1144]